MSAKKLNTSKDNYDACEGELFYYKREDILVWLESKHHTYDICSERNTTTYTFADAIGRLHAEQDTKILFKEFIPARNMESIPFEYTEFKHRGNTYEIDKVDDYSMVEFVQNGIINKMPLQVFLSKIGLARAGFKETRNGRLYTFRRSKYDPRR